MKQFLRALPIIMVLSVTACKQNSSDDQKSNDGIVKDANSANAQTEFCSDKFIEDYNILHQSCGSMESLDSAENCKLSLDTFVKVNPSHKCKAKTLGDQVVLIQNADVSKFKEKLYRITKE